MQTQYYLQNKRTSWNRQQCRFWEKRMGNDQSGSVESTEQMRQAELAGLLQTLSALSRTEDVLPIMGERLNPLLVMALGQLGKVAREVLNLYDKEHDRPTRS